MKPRTFPLPGGARRQHGFSLVELAMVLLVVGFLAALFLPATNTMLDNNRRKETRAKLEALEAAMTRYVMTNRRLPCPADGTQGVANASSGLEQRTAGPPATCTAMSTGVVPWRTLGVPFDSVIDAWGNLITYRVWARTDAGNGNAINTSLAMDDGMDMSLCDPVGVTPGLAPNFLCAADVPPLNYLIATLSDTDPPSQDARGFRACNQESCDATVKAAPAGANELARRVDGNGVAYFLISHGANKVHAYSSSGVLISEANGSGPSAREDINRNGVGLRVANLNQTFYIDADLDENEASYYDDIVLRPTVIKVALDAGLGPRVP